MSKPTMRERVFLGPPVKGAGGYSVSSTTRIGQITQVYSSGGGQVWDLREERRYKANLCEIERVERPKIGTVVSFELDEDQVAISIRELSPEEIPGDIQPLQEIKDEN